MENQYFLSGFFSLQGVIVLIAFLALAASDSVSHLNDPNLYLKIHENVTYVGFFAQRFISVENAS